MKILVGIPGGKIKTPRKKAQSRSLSTAALAKGGKPFPLDPGISISEACISPVMAPEKVGTGMIICFLTGLSVAEWMIVRTFVGPQ